MKPVKVEQNRTPLLSGGTVFRTCHMSRQILRKDAVGVDLELLAPSAKAVWLQEGDSAPLSRCYQQWR